MLKPFIAAFLPPVRLNFFNVKNFFTIRASTVSHAKMREDVGVLPMTGLESGLIGEFFKVFHTRSGNVALSRQLIKVFITHVHVAGQTGFKLIAMPFIKVFEPLPCGGKVIKRLLRSAITFRQLQQYFTVVFTTGKSVIAIFSWYCFIFGCF